jgi:release factor glutamine methyltransferase
MPEAASTGAGSARDTLSAALRRATAELGAAGIEDAGNDARRLLGAVLGLSGAELLSRPERELSAQESSRLERCVARRRDREPVSRILGEREFYGRSFAISPATLDPRPDSETLIETALEIVACQGWRTRPLTLLDVGTGSGCLLLTLLAELPNAVGVGTDISVTALDVARDNARRLGVANRAKWLVRDVLEDVEGPFDMLVNNPPYVRSDDIARLAPEVRCFDPLAALDGGDDGLRFFRRLSRRVPLVVPDGWVVVEVGYDQADPVAEILASALGSEPDAGPVWARRDVTGTRRCVAARTRKLSICGESPWILSPSEIG